MFVLGLFAGCESFVETDLPNSQLSPVAVFTDKTTANAAMTDIYSRMREKGMLSGAAFGLGSLMGVYTDELVFYGSASQPAAFFYNNSILPSDTSVADLWNSSYAQIYAANALLIGVSGSASLAPELKNQLRGEALFVRAVLHLYLADLYGGIPFVTSTDYRVNRTLTRLPIESVYSLIRTDLEEAITLLPENYLTADRIRPNKSAAHAVLARLELYAGNWAAAANEASAVLNNTAYAPTVTPDAEFLKTSPWTIWQFAPAANGKNTNEGRYYHFVSGPPPLVAMSDELVASFETADLRKSSWVKPVTTAGTTWYQPYKYKQQADTPASLEYSVVLRVAEQYLIRAEARARQGELIGAREDLNVIRHKAGLPDSELTTAAALIDAVLKERRLELFAEFGHRFFDLKRLQKLDEVLQPVKPGWDTYGNLLPLPEADLLANPFLRPQNPGY